MTRGEALFLAALVVVILLYSQQPSTLPLAQADSLGIDLTSAYANDYGNGAYETYSGSSNYSSFSAGDYTYQNESGGRTDNSMTGPGISLTGNDADTLARTIYGEARGNGMALMQGVASVVMNRVRAGYAHGSVSGVCLAPKQFSCWNSNDPNLPVIEAVTSSNAIFQQCLSLAQQAISGTLPDNTGGAVNYYATTISPPYWTSSMRETVQIGNTKFYAPAGLIA